MSIEDARRKYGKNYTGGYFSVPYWPKNKEQLLAMLQGAYRVGMQDGIITASTDARDLKLSVEPRVLEALVKLTNANAQLSESVSKALLSSQGNL